MKTFFGKLKYCFLIENTKTENATFLYKTAPSEVNDYQLLYFTNFVSASESLMKS